MRTQPIFMILIDQMGWPYDSLDCLLFLCEADHSCLIPTVSSSHQPFQGSHFVQYLARGLHTALLVHPTMTQLITYWKEERRSTGRKICRKLQRLVAFQASLEKEMGLQKRMEFWQQGEATFSYM